MEGFILIVLGILIIWLVKSSSGYTRTQLSNKMGRTMGRTLVGRGKRRWRL
jgi:hypothetical protein